MRAHWEKHPKGLAYALCLIKHFAFGVYLQIATVEGALSIQVHESKYLA